MPRKIQTQSFFYSKNFLLFFFLAFILLIGFWILSKYEPDTKDFKQEKFSKFIPTATRALTLTPTTIKGTIYYVSPSGNDINSGTNSTNAWKTIQKAIDAAKPGDGISLASGIYTQDIITKTNGTKDAPITIFGPKDAVINGAGSARIFEINHNFIVLKGFTLDGLFGNADSKDGYRDKLLFVQGKGIREGVSGLKVLNMTFKNAAGECLRLRYFAHDNEVAGSTFGPCGIADFKFPSDSKNGEGIYIGTSSNQWADGKNPTNDPDGSTRNWIHHNAFNTQGNECVDVKEGAFDNTIEYNTCTGQKDPESGGFDSRGDKNIFRYNETYGNLGAGVRLGGHTVNDITYGKNNEVYGNTIQDNGNGALSIQVLPQGKICENKLSNNGKRIIAGINDSSIKPENSCN